jgi:hypothetical protein
MQTFELKHLSLRAPLFYRGIENPPFAGLNPLPLLASGEGPGDEELFIFEAEDLIAFDAEDGPRLPPAPLPAPTFYGRLFAARAGEEGGKPPYTLSPGSYLFMQWRPAGEAELREGIEYFAREAWWEREKAGGPYLIRRLGEDGKVATQLWRSLEA